MGLNREADFLPRPSKEAVAAKTIAFKSIGCRTNQEETAALSRRLIDAGHRVVDTINDAHIIIVNTCSVTAEAESKTLRFLHGVSKGASNAKICLTGCFAQRSPEGLRAMAGVHWVVGNTRKDDIPEILGDESGGVYWGESSVAADSVLPCVSEPGPPAEGPRTRFFIKIQEGCDNRCAYCIVPLLRGRSRSASFSEILTVCRKAVESGYKEVVLTGTHIGQYREGGGGDMLSLVEAVIALPGDFRLRLSSLDPRDLTERLLSVIANEKKACRHLHVSVQSFSASVAAAMGRGGPYMETIAHRLASFRKSAPDAGIGGDFIVGFPGETEAMFMETVRHAAAIGFSYGHVFRYSPRENTEAASFADQIPDAEKTRRSAFLRDTLKAAGGAFIDRLTGTRHRIIVEEENPVQGIASNYLRMEAPGAHAKKNSWLDVTLVGRAPDQKICRAIPAVKTPS